MEKIIQQLLLFLGIKPKFKRNTNVNRTLYHYFYNLDMTGDMVTDIHRYGFIDVCSREINNVIEIKITLDRVGLFIGKRGRNLDVIKEYMSNMLQRDIKIILVENDLWKFNKYKS